MVVLFHPCWQDFFIIGNFFLLSAKQFCQQFNLLRANLFAVVCSQHDSEWILNLQLSWLALSLHSRVPSCRTLLGLYALCTSCVRFRDILSLPGIPKVRSHVLEVFVLAAAVASPQPSSGLRTNQSCRQRTLLL